MNRKTDIYVLIFWILFTMSLSLWGAIELNNLFPLENNADGIFFILKDSFLLFVAINISCPIWFFCLPFSLKHYFRNRTNKEKEL